MSGKGLRGRERKLPVGQFSILAMVRISEPVALTSVYPYLPSMIQSFEGVKPADVGFWTGTASAIFSVAQCLTAIPWGRASDSYGRKPILLMGLVNTMITSLLWGVSTNLWMALAARALSGAGNGNVGIIRTMVAELCPWKELQPRAFSLMPLVFSVGSIIGPMIGGSLANPLNRPSHDHSDGPLLWKFPYLLPNLISAVFFLVGIVIGILFLRETLNVGRRDYGIVLGDKLIAFGRRPVALIKARLFGTQMYSLVPDSPESGTLIPSKHDEETLNKEEVQVKLAPPSWSEAMSNQTLIYLAAYTFLAMHNTAFDQIVSVFMHQARFGPDVVPDSLPLRFNKGFGMSSQRIGFLFTLNGVFAMLFQNFVFPEASRRIGILKSLKFALLFMCIVYMVIPFTTLLEPKWLRETALFIVWLGKTFCTTFAFPCATILITNTAPSIRVLGTVNGITTTVGALGRAIGPSIVGYAFTWGIHNGYMVVPFWLTTFFGIAALPALAWAVEGDGFGNDDEEHDWSDSENDTADAEGDSHEVDKIMSPTGAMRLRPNVSHGRHDSVDPEELKDEVAPLNQHLQPPDTFSAVLSDTEDEGERAASPASHGRQRRHSRPRLRRRSSTPIGDRVGFKKLSSNLGVSMSGYGSGSEL